MILTALLFIASAIAVSGAVQTLAEGIVEEWAPRYITKQALYDKSRTLQPIMRELALSRQLASSQFIIDWAYSQNDPKLTRSALIELEGYRKNFKDNSYFVAFLSSGAYYHNNAKNEFKGKELRYTLDPKKESDAWFYNLIKQERDIHININPDIELKVTKLWIDVLIRDGDKILGIVGTGLDLTDFLNNVVEENDDGVTSLFIDHYGAIQLHRDKTLIDFGSIGNEGETQKTIDLIFNKKADRLNIRKEMEQLAQGEKNVATTFVDILGQRQLVGIVYLPEIDWYEITLIDLRQILPFSQFYTIVLVNIFTLLFALIIFHFTLNRLVLTPINQLDKAMGLIEKGEYIDVMVKSRDKGELGRLIQRFSKMAKSVLESRRNLEQKVQDRTVALERLTQIDPLTGLYNRRGMAERMEIQINRAVREKNCIGLLWIDIDLFKEINDTHGHDIGDTALKVVADIINNTIRPYDLAARWGGDEFLVLLQPADDEILAQLAERIRSAIQSHTFDNEEVLITVSIGGCLSTEAQSIDNLLKSGDQALYKAKELGRNRYYNYKHLSQA